VEAGKFNKERAMSYSEAKPEDVFGSWLAPQGIDFVSPEAEEAYRERATRIKDAIQLKMPDRVPVILSAGFSPAYYAGITAREAMYDYDKACRAYEQYTLDLAPDAHRGPYGLGQVYDLVDYKLFLWPGHGVGVNMPFQCLEAEYMKADEYDALIQDPSDFWMRVYLPRIMGVLEPFSKLSPFHSVIEMGDVGSFVSQYGRAEIRVAFDALFEAGEQAMKWREVLTASDRRAMAAGFPILRGGHCKTPFDVLGDTLRGTRGIMLDMYQRDGKLVEAMERLTPLMIELGVSGAHSTATPLVLIPLHKGADGFMSAEQYRMFYWPTLRKLILGLVDQGIMPLLFAEGSYNTRLEIIRDLPKSKVVWRFDQTDIFRAKEVLGDTACIWGNVPAAILSTGSTDDVKAYCKRLIDVAGKGGGFILAPGATLDTAKLENVRAMIEFTKEYGVYR
jgi:uroporphyrinogen-III decarboxylase